MENAKEVTEGKMKERKFSYEELISFGNDCWWESKSYWDANPKGDVTAKTIADMAQEKFAAL